MSTTPEAAAQLIFAPNVMHNQSLTTVKFLSACFTGAVAGILGLENLLGFALFFASTLFTSACIYAINCKGRPAKYLQNGLFESINPGQDNAFTFILVWTLFFGTSFPRVIPFCKKSNSRLHPQVSCTVSHRSERTGTHHNPNITCATSVRLRK